jgi:hypothetical protein
MKSVKFLLIYLFAINLIDALFTWVAVTSGTAYEVNPIVRFLLEQGPFVFFASKVGIISGALTYLYIKVGKCTDEKKLKSSKIVLVITSAIMTAVVLLGAVGVILSFLMG